MTEKHMNRLDICTGDYKGQLRENRMNQSLENGGMSSHKKTSYQKILAPIVIGAFFCFLCIYFGVGEYPDSVTYIEGSMDREPLYPLLLKSFRAVFGSGYLWAVIIMQNLFAFLVTWYLYHFICERFRLNLIFQWGILVVLLVPHILSRLLTPSGIILTNAILSEGITLTLYQLFFVLILKMCLERKKLRYAVWSLLVAFLTTLARGQMMPMLLLWMLFTVIVLCRHTSEWWKKCTGVVLVILVTLGTFGARSILIEQYNETMYGVHCGNTGGNMTILTNVIYSANEEDIRKAAASLPEEAGALLSKIHAQMQEQKLTSADAGTGILSRIRHHEDSHDRIKFEILYPELEESVRTREPELVTEQIRVRMDDQAGQYMMSLLKENIGGFLMTYLYVIGGGFIRTVAILHPVFAVYALLIYIVAIGLMWYLFKRSRHADASVIMALVLLMIAANVCATGLTIMCLSRYMIYNMAIFYVAGIVLLQEAWKRRVQEG